MDRLDRTLATAIAAGLLPAGAARPSDEGKPWPVVLLIALGAWLAAIPLITVIGMLLGDLLSRGAGPYVVGPLVLAGAVVVLRARGVPLFVEQLAVPALLVGGGALGLGLFRDMPDRLAAAVLAAVSFGVAWALSRAWLRVALGACAATFFAIACLPGRWASLDGSGPAWGVAWHASLAVAALMAWLQALRSSDGAGAHQAAALESIGAGAWLAAVAGLAAWSGMTFLVGASLGDAAQVGSGFSPRGPGVMLRVVSVALAIAAYALAAMRWPALRRPWCGAVALVLAALAWPMVALGGVLLALSQAATTQRWRIAAASAVAAAWIVGAFYYALAWPLATKALVLLGAGAVLGVLAWLARMQRDAPSRATPHAHPPTRKAAGLVALTGIATLAVANIGIVQKQRLIAEGRPVYVELAPVDPRSLMQGDFMRLAYALPGGAELPQLASAATGRRPHVIARVDARGVARLQRLDDGTPLATDELRIELTPKGGRWVLVSDAWFFREGDAARWQRARYAEFRVAAGGQALLVDLRGPALEPL
jgi:uncharacterized membrane-anchored protein